MGSRRWVITPRTTAGFALALALSTGAGIFGSCASSRHDDETRDRPRLDRPLMDRPLVAAASLFGSALGVAMLLRLNRQIRRRIAGDAARERRLRAEVTQAAATRAREERAQAEEALRLSSEELLRASELARVAAERARRLVDSNIIGVLFTRGDVVTDANDAYLEIVGHSREDLAAGKVRLADALARDQGARGEAAKAELAKRGAASPFETEVLRKDGSTVPVLLGVARIGSSPLERVCFVIDQTEKNRTLAALHAARAEAEDANRAKDEFLAVLSHELRSPLHAMLGWLSILKKSIATGRSVERPLETVERNVQLLARLVDDLLDISRIVAQKLAIEEAAVDLTKVVATAVENARPAAASKGVLLTCALADVTGRVMGDEKRLLQVAQNLLNNALAFTQRGGRVGISLTGDENRATLEVKDNGAGISPDFLPHVFERFRQSDASSTRRHGGLGLGLAIVKTLVELHGGQVEARSEGLSRGATFTVRLPLAPIDPELPRPSPDPVPPPPDLDGVTVLLVEDDGDGREALCISLELAGARVVACASTAEARRVMESELPDVIVSDIGMPGEDGYAFMRSVRALPGARIPSIAITGFVSKQDRDDAFDAGFDHHVAKPVQADALVHKIRDMVRKSGPRLRDQRMSEPLSLRTPAGHA
jgi:PAS domain S-box-containing protein